MSGSHITNKSTYAHELAHTLGLYHTFNEEDSNKVEQNIEHWIANKIPIIERAIADLRRYKQERYNDPYYRYYPEKRKTDPYLKYFDREIKYWTKVKADYPVSMRKNNLRFEKRKTTNFMDYVSKKIYFSKKQWEIMQEEIKQYYYEK